MAELILTYHKYSSYHSHYLHYGISSVCLLVSCLSVYQQDGKFSSSFLGKSDFIEEVISRLKEFLLLAR